MTEMALFVKGNIPASLQSDAAEKARQEVEDIIAQGEKPSSSKFKYTVYGAADVRQQIRTDQSEDLKECRLRSWKLFLMEKEEKQLSYQDAYQLLVQRYQKMGLAEKDIEFLEMYKYQVLQ